MSLALLVHKSRTLTHLELLCFFLSINPTTLLLPAVTMMMTRMYLPHRINSCFATLFALFFCYTTTTTTNALQQDLAIDVVLSDAAPTLSQYSMLASVALFGPFPKMTASKNNPGVLTLPLDGNPLLCHNITQADESSLAADTILLVPRGVCTFERKVYNAQKLGAKAAIIYGNLANRYALNDTVPKDEYDYDDITFPTEFHDYDCSKGEAYIPANALSFDPLPYNSKQNDPLLSGDSTTNMCRERSKNGLSKCSSNACLLTGEKNEANGQMKACCAWDLHIIMHGDYTMEDEIRIPSAYITFDQGSTLMKNMQMNSKVSVTLYARWRPEYNVSSALIWALGVAAAALASWLSAHDYHRYTAKLIRRKKQAAEGGGDRVVTNRQQRSEPHAQAPVQEELTVWHALAFIVMASTMLLVLFYLKIYSFIKVMYALGCSKATASVLLDPIIKVCMKRVMVKNRIIWRTDTEDFGDITIRDIISHVVGYSLGLAWVIVAFTIRHPDRLTFFWVTQDVFGVCMCVLFLQVIKLNSLKVASALLIVAFFYDIFFVFLSPYVFKKSVMIDVATSGGLPTADPLWCEK